MRIMRWTGLAVLLLNAVASAIGFKILDATIDPAPGQLITVVATGTGQVQGMDLNLVTTGAQLLVTNVGIAGTIWEPNHTTPDWWAYPSIEVPDPGHAVMYITTASGYVSTPGTLAIVTVDATGLGGMTATITADTDYGPSNFANIAATGFEDGTITIRALQPPTNDPPVVDAGVPQTVIAGNLVTLNGVASDPESAPLTLEWVQMSGPTVTLNGANTATPTLTAPTVSTATALLFFFRASDGTHMSNDSTTVTVNPRTDGEVVAGTPPETPDTTEEPLPDTPTDNTGTQTSGGSNDTTNPPPTNTGTDNNSPTTTPDNTSGDTSNNATNTETNPQAMTGFACGAGFAEMMMLTFGGLLLLSRRR